MKKIILLIFGCSLLLLIGTCIYFVAGVSATFPPIKTYEYNGNVDEFMNKLKKYGISNSTVKMKIEDTLGDKQTGIGYEITIKYKSKKSSDTLIYEIKCVMTSPSSSTLVKLIGAHDLTKNTGGYGVKADGMGIILKSFNEDIILPLKNNGVVLKLL